MIKIVSGLAVAGMLAFAAGTTGAQAQSSTFGRVVSGEPAKLNKAMTQSQARKVCAQQMRGAKESKAAIRVKMDNCVREQQQGN